MKTDTTELDHGVMTDTILIVACITDSYWQLIFAKWFLHFIHCEWNHIATWINYWHFLPNLTQNIFNSKMKTCGDLDSNRKCVFHSLFHVDLNSMVSVLFISDLNSKDNVLFVTQVILILIWQIKWYLWFKLWWF